VLYGGAGDDEMLWGGEDVLCGGDGNDYFDDWQDGHRNMLYCGEGRDKYVADKIDYVDSSCEVKW
jgi:Ca2+-binding RTX toxin-like protein